MTANNDKRSHGQIDRRHLLKGTAATSLAWMAGASAIANRAEGHDAERDATLIQRENQHAGSTDWQLTRVRVDQSTFRSPWIEGYCSKQSVAAGESIDIMVSTDPVQDFTIEIFQINAPGMTGERMSRLLRARGIQALILSPRLPGPGPIPDLEWEHFSVVASGYSITNLAVHRCCPHQAHNVLLALQELRRRGYRRTGLILSPSVNLRTRGNILGAYLADQRARPPAERLDLLLEEGVDRSMLQRWLRAQKADSVLLTDYPMQYLAMIRDLGHAVPADFGVAQLSRSGDTDAIAGIDEQMELLGEATAKFAISLLRHNERGLPAFPRYSLVEGRWVDRPTVRAATGDPK